MKLIQLSALLLLTIQNTALVLVTKLSYSSTTEPYVVSTVIACSECLKCFVSCVLVFLSEGAAAFYNAFREIPTNAVRLSLPSFLYVVQNNLLFEGVRLLSPTVFTACSQSKILMNAFFSRIMLGTQLTSKQALALCTLVLGIVLVQSERDELNDTSQSVGGTSFMGLISVFAASVTSGFAGTYMEKIYKELDTSGKPSHSIWVRNMQLASFSIPMAIFTAYWQDGKVITTYGVFTGYDSVVLVVIALQAIGGLIIAAVMRYASNVLKCFAVSLSICYCAIATAYMSGDGKHGLCLQQTLGIALVIGATFNYAAQKAL
mmetsp:Transcript_2099/g.6946  ORF Transcript_2099/g.6946 Transcript_2099/m.6946 type:complete len:318 (-) Transcript_2099:1472-2425(-)